MGAHHAVHPRPQEEQEVHHGHPDEDAVFAPQLAHLRSTAGASVELRRAGTVAGRRRRRTHLAGAEEPRPRHQQEHHQRQPHQQHELRAAGAGARASAGTRGSLPLAQSAEAQRRGAPNDPEDELQLAHRRVEQRVDQQVDQHARPGRNRARGRSERAITWSDGSGAKRTTSRRGRCCSSRALRLRSPLPLSTRYTA